MGSSHRDLVLGDYGSAYFGIQTHDRKRYVSTKKKSGEWRPVIDGQNILPYHMLPPSEFVWFTQEAIKSGGKPDVYARRRIGIRQIGPTPVACILEPNILTLNTVYNFYLFDPEQSPSLEFLLGIILSNAGKWFWKSRFQDYKATFPKVKKDAILAIPVPVWKSGQAAKRHDAVQKIVREITRLTASRPERTTSAQTKGSLGQLNKLIYEAFGLADEEIAVIEADIS
jgi:hypothetical protein